MGTSLYDQFLQTQQTPKPPRTLYDQFLAEQKAQPQGHDYHAEFKSGALQRRMAGANARDMASAREEDAAQPGYLERAATHVLNTAQGIPGVEAVEAAAGSGPLENKTGVVSPGMTYAQSLQQLRENTNQIGGKTRAVEKIAGSLATLPLLPSNPAVAGAALGAADQLADADPNRGLASRGIGAGIGAAVGAATGKGAEMLTTAARALPPFSKNAASNLLSRQFDRARIAKQLYDSGMKEGQGKTATPIIQKFLAEPDIAEIVNDLSQSRSMRGLAADSPEMLNEVYQALSDRVGQLKRGLGTVTPSRPNTGRLGMSDARGAQKDLLSAIDPVMPSYRAAVDDYAARSQGIDAVKRGYSAVRTGIQKGIPHENQLTRTTPEAFEVWGRGGPSPSAQPIAPEYADDAAQGALGAVRASFGAGIMGPYRRALWKAAPMMRSVNAPSQAFADQLANALLVARSAARRD